MIPTIVTEVLIKFKTGAITPLVTVAVLVIIPLMTSLLLRATCIE